MFGEFYHFKCYVIWKTYQMLPIAHWPVKIQGIGEDMPSNMLFFINFEPLKLYWTYFLALQTMTPKIPPMRLMSLDHESKMRWCAMSLNHGLWRFLCKYGLFWALREVFPKSMLMLMWYESPMEWSYMVWKICPQHSAPRVHGLALQGRVRVKMFLEGFVNERI